MGPKEDPASPQKVRPLKDTERDAILAALELNAGNQVKTAQALDIALSTLKRKLKEYDTY